MANKATKMKEEATAYMGAERAALLETFTKKDWDDYYKLDLDLDQSYFVRGSKEALDKFTAFYLMRSSYEKPLFAYYFLSEYIAHVGSVIATQDPDEISFTEKDLLFLYVHDNLLGTGNSEAWVFTAALNKITNRNRLGFRTIVLSERNIGLLNSSSELINIRLGGSIENRDLSTSQVKKPTEDNTNSNKDTAKEEQTMGGGMENNTAY